jgi:hypothetical protein
MKRLFLAALGSGVGFADDSWWSTEPQQLREMQFKQE